MIVAHPKDWDQFITKIIALLWTFTYVIYWIASLRFPKIFIYFLPLLLVIIQLISLGAHTSRVNAMEEKTS